MKRRQDWWLGLLLVFLSGCLNTVDVETRVRRDGSVARSMEFVIDEADKKRAFHDVFELPPPPQWRVHIRDEKGKHYHYAASRDFPASRQTHTDFTIRLFKPNSPLAQFVGKNEWRVTKRRGLFHTTYVYEETLRFPGLKEAYVKALSDTLYQQLMEQLNLNDANKSYLSSMLQAAVAQAVDNWAVIGRNSEMVNVIAHRVSRSLRESHTGIESAWSWELLRQQIEEAHKRFMTTHYKKSALEEGKFLYLFRLNLPGTVTRTNGQVYGANVRWNIAIQDEIEFHDLTLFAESRVFQVNYLALISLLVLFALPIMGVVWFCRHYKLIVRVARRTTW
jgi:hypothetical protein